MSKATAVLRLAFNAGLSAGPTMLLSACSGWLGSHAVQGEPDAA
jgi:hypothetical protein